MNCQHKIASGKVQQGKQMVNEKKQLFSQVLSAKQVKKLSMKYCKNKKKLFAKLLHGKAAGKIK
jgi:hypothetical protein